MDKYVHSISIVIPVYNSEKTIAKLLLELYEVLECFTSYKIILVDDDSKDTSFKTIKENYNEHILALSLAKNHGQQLAIFKGLQLCDSDYVVIIDDDLEQNPADIITLYKEVIKGFNVVYGLNQMINQKGYIRSFGSKVRDFLFNQLTNKPRDLKVCSFRIIDRKTVNQIITAKTLFVYISMEILKYTNNIGNVFLKYNENNQSNYKLSSLIKLFLNIYIYYSNHFISNLFKKDMTEIKIKEELK